MSIKLKATQGYIIFEERGTRLRKGKNLLTFEELDNSVQLFLKSPETNIYEPYRVLLFADCLGENNTPFTSFESFIDFFDDNTNPNFNSGGGSGIGAVIQNDITVTLSGGKSLGRYLNGSIIPSAGKTPEEVFNLLASEYAIPNITSFSILEHTLPVEVGTTISGNKTFVWGITNSSNIPSASISISDINGGSGLLASGLSNDSVETLNVGTVTKNTATTNTWTLSFIDTESIYRSSSTTIGWLYLFFYGATSGVHTLSSQVRALPATRFSSEGVSWNLNTGNTLITFVVAIPNNYSLINVIDLDALSADITSSYILKNTVTVNLQGTATKIYSVYTMTVAVPYSTNHRHQITIA